MKSGKKKKRSRAAKPGGKVFVPGQKGDERRDVNVLAEAFSSLSLQATTHSGCGQAVGIGNVPAEVSGSSVDNNISSEEDRFKSSTSSSFSSAWSASSGSHLGYSSSEGTSGSSPFEDDFHMKGGCGGGGKRFKRLAASTGTVSAILGKDYVMSRQRGDRSMQKGYDEHDREPLNVEEMEQFLCSMLGHKSELSMAVVKDVLCCCGFDVEKSLDALLKLSGSSFEDSESGMHDHTTNIKNDAGFLFECNPPFLDGVSDSTSFSSENELLDNVELMGYGCRNYAEVLAGSETCSLTGPGITYSRISQTGPGSTDLDLSQKVLESLFNMPKSSQRDPNTMNWRNVVKKMESLGQGIHLCPSDITESWKNSAEGNEYVAFRKDAKQHWDSMRACYQRAAAAYSNGKQHSASYLSEQGKVHSKMAQEADEKASKEIFKSRNKSIENVVTIDLHGQHIKQAINLLKAHLLFGAYVHSIQFLKVITGCGTHGVGKSKLKQSVINLLKREGIEWKEENPGSVLIKLEGHRELSFLDSEDDS